MSREIPQDFKEFITALEIILKEFDSNSSPEHFIKVLWQCEAELRAGLKQLKTTSCNK